MLSAHYVGTAPGTTTFRTNSGWRPQSPGTLLGLGAGGYVYPPPDGGPGVPPYPTQAWLVPTPSNEDVVKIAVPPNQQVTGETEMILRVPDAQKSMGPAPTDQALSYQRGFYFPVQRGWIHTNQKDLYNLQGAVQPTIKFQGPGWGQATDAEKEAASARRWSIFASVVGALAVATTATIAVLEYRRRKRR